MRGAVRVCASTVRDTGNLRAGIATEEVRDNARVATAPEASRARHAEARPSHGMARHVMPATAAERTIASHVTARERRNVSSVRAKGVISVWSARVRDWLPVRVVPARAVFALYVANAEERVEVEIVQEPVAVEGVWS